MENKNFTEILEEIRAISDQLNNPNTSMEESIELFEKGTELINNAKQYLQTVEGKVKKVLEDNSQEDFK